MICSQPDRKHKQRQLMGYKDFCGQNFVPNVFHAFMANVKKLFGRLGFFPYQWNSYNKFAIDLPRRLVAIILQSKLPIGRDNFSVKIHSGKYSLSKKLEQMQHCDSCKKVSYFEPLLAFWAHWLWNICNRCNFATALRKFRFKPH